MPLERSAGVVIFRQEGGKRYYLLLHYPKGSRKPEPYWDFPKGHIEKGEKPPETARRETAEETGLTDINFVEGFKEWIKYFFKDKGKTVFKIVTFYLAETGNKEVKISFEHVGFEWLLYNEASKKLTFNNAKKILQKAESFLEKHAADS